VAKLRHVLVLGRGNVLPCLAETRLSLATQHVIFSLHQPSRAQPPGEMRIVQCLCPACWCCFLVYHIMVLWSQCAGLSAACSVKSCSCSGAAFAEQSADKRATCESQLSVFYLLVHASIVLYTCCMYAVAIIIIIINPCKPYHFGIGTAPHPLGRWRVD
jgi:hypothetical protein